MTPWLSYARASTDEQTTSCRQQHDDNVRAAGGAPARTFDDDGVRGSVPIDERPALVRLLALLRANPPGTFVVRAYDTSRLGRFLDPDYHFVAEWMLKTAGARSIAYTRGGYTEGRSVANSVLKVVEAHSNRAYSEKLSREVHRGLIDAVRRGDRSGGFAPYGYDLEYRGYDGTPYARVRFDPVGGGERAFRKLVTDLGSGRVEVLGPEQRFVAKTKPARSRLVPGDPARVEAAKFIFDRFLAGRGFRTLALELAARGSPSPEGNGWSIPGVRSIITNPEYTGRAVYGRRSESKFHALEQGGGVRVLAEGEVPAKRQWRVGDEARWIVTEGAHEALISPATFAAAQARREAIAEDRQVYAARAKAHEPFLLSGILFCPDCGRPYTGSRKKRGPYRTSYYLCGSFARGSGCRRGSAREEVLDAMVLDDVALTTGAAIPEEILEEEVRIRLVAALGPGQGEDRVAGELARVERDLQAIVANVSAENLPLFDARLTRLRERRAELLGQASAPSAAPMAFDLEAAVEASVSLARRLRWLMANPGPESVIELRERILPKALGGARIAAYIPEGYLEIRAAEPSDMPVVGANGSPREVRRLILPSRVA